MMYRVVAELLRSRARRLETIDSHPVHIAFLDSDKDSETLCEQC